MALKSRHSYLAEKKMEEDKLLVAVFDSFREKLNNTSKILNSSMKKGEFQSLPEFALVEIDIQEEPVLIKKYNKSVILDVYEITERELDQLDKHYGFISIHNINNINNREKIETPYGKAYVYTNNRKLEKIKIIESGDWNDHYNYKTIIESPTINLN